MVKKHVIRRMPPPEPPGQTLRAPLFAHLHALTSMERAEADEDAPRTEQCAAQYSAVGGTTG